MAFTSTRVFFSNPDFIPMVAKQVATEFQAEDYTVELNSSVTGDAEISITKGGIFKSIVGLKTALKISIVKEEDHIKATAGVGIFGQQAIPTAITLLIAWPVLVTQIWGLIQQSKLDDHAIDLIAKSLERLEHNSSSAIQGGFCPNCGAKTNGKFCAQCGQKL